MPDSKITEILNAQRSDLLTNWVREQLTSQEARPDLLSEPELRVQCERFLSVLSNASKSGDITNIHQPAFQGVLEFLTELSRSRGRQGFSPSETATFIFSLKQPFFQALKETHSKDSEGVFQDTWDVSVLLDKLGLYTTEIYQQTRDDIIRRQQEEMLELSTPVVQLWDGIVALPLIGTLDSARTSIVMETLLQTIVETRSEIAIIDITGVPTVDTLVAQHLLKTVAAARLMGADCIISGIRPQIAQTMVHLQIDLSTVTTKATMAEALRVALKRTGFVVGRPAKPTVA